MVILIPPTIYSVFLLCITVCPRINWEISGQHSPGKSKQTQKQQTQNLLWPGKQYCVLSVSTVFRKKEFYWYENIAEFTINDCVRKIKLPRLGQDERVHVKLQIRNVLIDSKSVYWTCKPFSYNALLTQRHSFTHYLAILNSPLT